MRLLLGALAFPLCAACAQVDLGTRGEPAADGAGGAALGGDTGDSGDSDLGVAEEEMRITECEEGCMTFFHAGCANMQKECKGKGDDDWAYVGQWQTSCWWALALACSAGSGFELHKCFSVCNGWHDRVG